MILAIDTSSPIPPYEQIRAQIADLAAVGALAVGDRLPTIRQLAADLALAPGTVARAYRELETAGVVTSRVRHGTEIAARSKPTKRQASAQLATAARAYATVVAALGVDRDAAIVEFDRQRGELPG